MLARLCLSRTAGGGASWKRPSHPLFRPSPPVPRPAFARAVRSDRRRRHRSRDRLPALPAHAETAARVAPGGARSTRSPSAGPSTSRSRTPRRSRGRASRPTPRPGSGATTPSTSPRSPCTAPTSGAPCAGWPTRSCSSVPAMVASTTPTAPSPRARRPARCRSTRCGCGTARSRFSPAPFRSPEPRVLARLLAWLDDRSGLITAGRHALEHPVPPRTGWWYVFGSATLIAFILQVATGSRSRPRTCRRAGRPTRASGSSPSRRCSAASSAACTTSAPRPWCC